MSGAPMKENWTSSSSTENSRPRKHNSKDERPIVGAKPNSSFSVLTKLGRLAICVLTIGAVLELGCIAFLWFLWLADDKNNTWRAIVDRDWIPRAVTLLSLALRQSISFQASTATGMIASIALERSSVLLLDLASISLTRNANGGPYTLFWWLWKAFRQNPNRWRTVYWPLLITLLASTTMLLQLTSFTLLSDVALGIVQATKHQDLLPTHFRYNANGTIPVFTHGSTWSQGIQSYSSFAEYHEPAVPNLPDGILDTGKTLRAFPPVADEQSRSMLSTWDGIATVLDARSMCFRPHLLEPRVHYADGFVALATGFEFPNSTAIIPSDYNLVRTGNPGNCSLENCPGSTACIAPLTLLRDWGADKYDLYRTDYSQWRLSICQPNGLLLSYAMQSQFGNPTSIPSHVTGNAYLVVNVSSGTDIEWSNVIPGEDPNLGIFRGAGTPPVGFSVHGQNNEWYDLIFSEDAKLNLSVSVCYTAFDIADLSVTMDANSNHSDINPKWDANTQQFNYTKIRAQLGQSVAGPASYSANYTSRNILKLHRRSSWLPQSKSGDYLVPSNRRTPSSWITDYSNMAGSLQSRAFVDNQLGGANYTRFLWRAEIIPDLWQDQLQYDYADPSLMGLVQEILQAGGSLAFAMQSIVTSLTELAFYQQVQQLNGDSNVISSSYVVSSIPLKMRGLIAVTTVLGVHIILVFALILPSFWCLTNLSAIGNAWHAVAQIVDPKTKPILERAALSTDEEAEKAIKWPVGKKGKLKNRDIVGITSADGVTVNVVSQHSGRERSKYVGVKSGEQDNTLEVSHLEQNRLLEDHARIESGDVNRVASSR